MDPAVVLAAAVACCSLATWLLLSLPKLGRAVAAVRIPAGLIAGRMAGPMAGLVTGSLLLAVVVRERPARAATPPPVVRLGAAAPGPSPVDTAPQTVRESSAVHVVVAGDSLWAIARRHLEAVTGEEPSPSDVDRFWKAIYVENRRVVGDDPNLIFPAQRLRLPKV
jgi:hypothetical protein